MEQQATNFTLPSTSLKQHKRRIKVSNKAMWDNPASVLENLYLSSIEPSRNQRLLDELDIKLVISVTEYVDPPEGEGIGSIIIPIDDNVETDIKCHFSKTNKAIDEYLSRNESVLVHCMAGNSRSATVVLAYLIYKGIILRDAFKYLSTCRPSICPNLGFFQQLGEYEMDLHHVIAPTYLKEDYIIDKLSKGVGKGLPRDVIRDSLEMHEWNEKDAVFEIFKRKRRG